MPDHDLPSGPRPGALLADGRAAYRVDLSKAFLAQCQCVESLVSRWADYRTAAADLVQELFLRSQRRPATPMEELGSYLLCSARNLVIDHLRDGGSWQRQLDDWLPEQHRGRPVGPGQVLEAGNQWRRVKAILRGLPERTRRIFLFNRVHGRTYAEIAQATQLPQSVVEGHVARTFDACKVGLASPADEQARSAQ